MGPIASTTWDPRGFIAYQGDIAWRTGRNRSSMITVQFRPHEDAPIHPPLPGYTGPREHTNDCGCMNCREYLKGER